jgi:hypothetical protein
MKCWTEGLTFRPIPIVTRKAALQMNANLKTTSIPPKAGVGLKSQHYRSIIETAPDMGFFEVHAENYMGDGGPPHRYLTAIRERYPISLHGVGLSIGADKPLDPDHLSRLKALLNRYEPGLFVSVRSRPPCLVFADEIELKMLRR